MDIGVPKEIKPREGRVALLPEACAALTAAGHRVFIESGAGRLSGYADSDYKHAGVHVVANAQALYAAAKLIVKVKEPIGPDLAFLRKQHILFCFLHLAAQPELIQILRKLGLTAIGFETVETDSGQLPLLAPMSAIAGRVAMQVATHLLHQPQGGSGLLLGGLTGVTEPGRVVVLGAGIAGGNAAQLAAAIGADVQVFDLKREKLDYLQQLNPSIRACLAEPKAIARAVAAADILIGAVLVTGERAPRVVTAKMIAGMRPGSVAADISVDQGGCLETTRPTSYEEPTYTVDGVIHFCVTNMPGAVPRTAAQALSSAVLPYVLKIASGAAIADDRELARGLNIQAGDCVHPALKRVS